MSNVVTLEKLKIQNREKAEKAAMEYAKVLLPMNYSDDPNIIGKLSNDDKKDIASALGVMDKLSDVTKLSLLPKTLTETHIQAAIISQMVDDLEDVRNENSSLQNYLRQNVSAYDEGEIDRLREYNKQLQGKNISRQQRRAKAREVGLQSLDRSQSYHSSNK